MEKRERPIRTPVADVEVLVHSMKESNGRITWSAFLSRKGDDLIDRFQFSSSLSEGRVRYDADEMKWFLGQGPKPYLGDKKYDPTIPDDQSSTHEGNIAYVIERELEEQAKDVNTVTAHFVEPRQFAKIIWQVNGKIDVLRLAKAICRR